MPGSARKDIVVEGAIRTYHCWSRCVQRAFLCGRDPATGEDFDFRRDQIHALIKYQSEVFAVDVGAVSVLSNHMHQVIRTRPDVADSWDDEEVALRWRLAWPAWRDGQWTRQPTDEQVREVLADSQKLQRARRALSSLSWLQARIKEPAARLFNTCSGASGHVFDQRYGCRLLETNLEVLTGLAYVDLNQLRAAMAGSLEESRCSSIRDRLQAWRQREARAAVEAFDRGGEDPCQLTQAEAELLLADCYLAPIADDGPLLLDTRDQRVEQAAASATTLDGGRGPFDVGRALLPDSTERPSGPPEAQPAERQVTQGACGPAERGAPVRRRRPPRPTFEIYRRRFLARRRSRRRASDNAILGLPFAQYEQLLRRAAERQPSAAPETRHSQPPPNVAPPGQASYRRAAEQFSNWLLKALGSLLPKPDPPATPEQDRAPP